MTQEERYGTRDLVYSAWHRRHSTCRFIGASAQSLAMIDLDAIEYDDRTKAPLALIEAARDVGQTWKATTVMVNLAKRANLPAYVVLYTVASSANPADTSKPDISGFRVKQLWPKCDSVWQHYNPNEWASVLLRLRTQP